MQIRTSDERSKAYKAECDRVLLSRTARSNGTKFSPNSNHTHQSIFDRLKEMQLRA